MNTRLILLFLTFFVGEYSTLGLKCRICQEAFIEESCNEYPELQMHGCKVVNTYFLPSKLSVSKKVRFLAQKSTVFQCNYQILRINLLIEFIKNKAFSNKVV